MTLCTCCRIIHKRIYGQTRSANKPSSCMRKDGRCLVQKKTTIVQLHIQSQGKFNLGSQETKKHLQTVATRRGYLAVSGVVIWLGGAHTLTVWIPWIRRSNSSSLAWKPALGSILGRRLEMCSRACLNVQPSLSMRKASASVMLLDLPSWQCTATVNRGFTPENPLHEHGQRAKKGVP